MASPVPAVQVARYLPGGELHFAREHFLNYRWQYRPGQHTTVLAPTDCGKTHLSYQLLQRTETPDLPGIVMVIKPRDTTVVEWAGRLRQRTVYEWPPPLRHRVLRDKPPGWVVWPKHTFDPDSDDAHIRRVMRAVMLDSYKRGNRILFADEIAGIENDLGLRKEARTLWTRARSMGTGLWAASQRPVDVSLLAYSQSSHLFLHNDPDERDRKRFAEIGGVNPRLVEEITLRLPKWHYLYIRREGPRMCSIGP